MSRPVRLLSLLSRLASAASPSSSSANSCRFSSRRWSGPSHHVPGQRAGEEQYEGGEDLENMEDKIQALFHAERKRQKTVKYHMVKRKMTPSGAPQRSLTWEAMEQIRYLRQEQPEEWTVERLAEGYSVPPDVILRVLRSKFVPSPQKKAKQNAKVMAAMGQQVLPSGTGTQQDRLKLPGDRTQARLSPGNNTEAALVPAANHSQVILGEPSQSLTKSLIPALPAQFVSNVGKDVTRTEEDDNIASYTEEEEEESWDGCVFTEEELEEFIDTEIPSPVVQVGKDFFDTEGNFLYRI